jgi:transcriptional regulator with GAF, ATPase, and Fis domain
LVRSGAWHAICFLSRLRSTVTSVPATVSESTALVQSEASVAPQDTGPVPVARSFELPADGLVFEDLERELVRQALERTGFNQTRAAKLLGMTRDQIRYRVRKFGLAREDKRLEP